MTDDLTKLRAELRAGLDGVMPDSWKAFTGIVLMARNVSLNAIHIARCSPDNIRALLDALDAAERERDEARAALATAQNDALEEAAKLAERYGGAREGDLVADVIRSRKDRAP